MIRFGDRPDLAQGLRILLDGEDVGERCTGFDLEAGSAELLLLRDGKPYVEVVDGDADVAREIRTGRLEVHLTRLPAYVAWADSIMGACGELGVNFTPEQRATLEALP